MACFVEWTVDPRVNASSALLLQHCPAGRYIRWLAVFVSSVVLYNVAWRLSGAVLGYLVKTESVSRSCSSQSASSKRRTRDLSTDPLRRSSLDLPHLLDITHYYCLSSSSSSLVCSTLAGPCTSRRKKTLNMYMDLSYLLCRDT
jgi:hypothetical protein